MYARTVVINIQFESYANAFCKAMISTKKSRFLNSSFRCRWWNVLLTKVQLYETKRTVAYLKMSIVVWSVCCRHLWMWYRWFSCLTTRFPPLRLVVQIHADKSLSAGLLCKFNDLKSSPVWKGKINGLPMQSRGFSPGSPVSFHRGGLKGGCKVRACSDCLKLLQCGCHKKRRS